MFFFRGRHFDKLRLEPSDGPKVRFSKRLISGKICLKWFQWSYMVQSQLIAGEMNMKKQNWRFLVGFPVELRLGTWIHGDLNHSYFLRYFMDSLLWIHGVLRWWLHSTSEQLSNPRIFGYMEYSQMWWNEQLGWSFSPLVSLKDCHPTRINQLLEQMNWQNSIMFEKSLSDLVLLIINTLSLSSWG